MARRSRTDDRETHRFWSSHVSRAWWDPADEELEVLFHDGDRYIYTAVDENVWEHFKSASSAGRFVQDVLSQHRYHPA